MAPMKAKTIMFNGISSQLRLAWLAFVQSIPYNSQHHCCWGGARLRAVEMGKTCGRRRAIQSTGLGARDTKVFPTFRWEA